LRERDFAREHEEALAENAAEDEKTKKRYSIADAVRRANEIVSVYDETLGEFRFGILSVKEFNALDLSKCNTKQEMLDHVVHAMLHKANPDIALADLAALPQDDYTIIVSTLSRYLPGFLRMGKQVLKTGSALT
jgi:hypothetical protein